MNTLEAAQNPYWRDPAELTRDELVTLVRSMQESMDRGTHLLDVTSSKLIATMHVANTIGAQLCALLDSHDAGDAEAVYAHLARLSALRAQQKGVKH